MSLIITIFVFINQIKFITSFARNLITDYCDRKLEIGVVMMGKQVEEAFDKNITVFRNNIQLQSGDVFYNSDELIINMDPKSFQMVLEVQGNAKFSKGYCKNKVRTVDSGGAALVVGSNNEIENKLEIKGAFAFSYSTGCWLLL